ncbi:hypothetical protein AGMMS49532_06030 [Endomicrobiia bacterium]|uniref:hypothetical protein n=1 Tax=Endomicrobium trichonymphae TaxID=1408204 RepID=UPI0003220B8A|nr:hypothetical protein [Candidatus Endomicrobium trichonymphae]GHT09105.1 hypothetical protein AGMMS49532_06030 [Endomicrobiia bacterium]GHT22704.1 hypothetical protein AGMMS49953_02010 [Endomicrobiia bacterium]
MFAFIQVYIITVNDIIANEAAFVAMHSAAVTRNKYHYKEGHRRKNNYLTFFYPAAVFGTSSFNLLLFVLSDKSTRRKIF